jgi:hypothetical protein
LTLEVAAQVIDLDVAIDHQAFGPILHPRHAQPDVPLRIGDGQLLPQLAVAVLGQVPPA